MPRQERTNGEMPSFDVRAVSKVASESEDRLEVRGALLRKACKCSGTSSTGHLEKNRNPNGGLSLSYDPNLRCDICGTPWIGDAGSGL